MGLSPVTNLAYISNRGPPSTGYSREAVPHGGRSTEHEKTCIQDKGLTSPRASAYAACSGPSTKAERDPGRNVPAGGIYGPIKLKAPAAPPSTYPT